MINDGNEPKRLSIKTISSATPEQLERDQALSKKALKNPNLKPLSIVFYRRRLKMVEAELLRRCE